MVTYQRKRLVEIVKVTGILAWMAVAGAGVLLTRDQPEVRREMFAYSFIITILVASFFYGRPGGLLVALVSSLISGSLVIGGPGTLESPATQRVMFQIVFFNIVALVTSELSERERVAKTRYHSLFENVAIGLYYSTPAGKILDANSALVQMLGYPDREALLAANVADLYLDPAIYHQRQAAMSGKGRIHDFEAQVRQYDGTVIWVCENSRTVRNRAGLPLGYEGAFEDVTERMQAEEKLAAVHVLGQKMVLSSDVQQIAGVVVENARHILDFRVCSLWLVDQEREVLVRRAIAADQPVIDTEPLPLDRAGDIAVAVVQNAKMLYLPDATADPRHIPSTSTSRSALCVPMEAGRRVIGALEAESDRPNAFTAADQRTFQTLADVAAVALENARLHQALANQAVRLEEQVVKRTAELRERVGEAEQLNRTMATLLEDLQAANRLSQETARRLEEANAELESFAYSVSHDLRAPLRAIGGFSRILLDEYASQVSPEIARYLQMIQDNARRMGQLIDDLLSFSRLSRQPLTKQPLATADLVHQVLEDLHQEQEGRHVEVSIGDLPACEGDPVLIRQVFANLLANALKFTRNRDVARIEVGCQLNPDGVPIYFVKDNGVGFDMRYASRLFGVFQRLHSDQEYEGTGVGLAIVQRIVRRHGGYIWAEAEVDCGATFCFALTGGISDA